MAETSTTGRKVALVTGGATGIGLAIVTRLAREGYTVYAASRNPGTMESPAIIPIRMDVRKREAVEEALAQIDKDDGKLDALVNCAGIGMIGPIEHAPYGEMAALMETNFLGAILATQCSLPLLRKGEAAVIVNIGSIAGRMGLPFQGIYSASKAALKVMTEALDIELGGSQVRAVVIEPGDYRTGLTQKKTVFWGPTGTVPPGMRDAVMASIERDARNGRDVSELAELVCRIVARKEDPRDGIVGPRFQVFSALIRPLVPLRVFRAILKRHFGIP